MVLTTFMVRKIKTFLGSFLPSYDLRISYNRFLVIRV